MAYVGGDDSLLGGTNAEGTRDLKIGELVAVARLHRCSRSKMGLKFRLSSAWRVLRNKHQDSLGFIKDEEPADAIPRV